MANPFAASADWAEDPDIGADRPGARRCKTNGEDAAEALIIDTSAPYTVAKTFVEQHFANDAGRLLRHHRGGFYNWAGCTYSELGEKGLRARLYEFLDGCLMTKGEPVKPTAHLVNNVLDALKAVAHLDDAIEPPAWLDKAPDLAATDIVPCRNGLLHLPSLTLASLTPHFFGLNAIDLAYQPNAPTPVQWLKFLAQLWGGDVESIDALQEMFGLCLTGDTRHQKAFLLVGPKRSGKGTIGHILRALVGADNAGAPTLASLGTNFGLAPLIGKRIAVVSDARLGGRADQQVIAERLLSITGEDAIDVDRKFRDAWTGRLQVRFILMTNELPRLADTSGALASRFIILRLTRSFYGNEDLGLRDRLLTELPGILNWALAGLARLRQRGHFMQPTSAAEDIQTLEDLSSPIAAFLRDCCDFAPQFMIERGSLYQAWCRWCETQGRDHPGTLEVFGRDLKAAVPTITSTQPRDTEGNRRRFYQGLKLKW
jgi:putative DNA primase/helicase